MKGIEIGLLATAAMVLSCGEEKSSSYECEVTLRLLSMTTVSSSGTTVTPSGQGTGKGRGETQEEAMRAALKIACSQLPLRGQKRLDCEAGREVGVEVGGSFYPTLIRERAKCEGKTSSSRSIL